MTAHYSKLKKGWGVKVFDQPFLEKGDLLTVEVTRKDGKARNENVEVIWTGQDKFKEEEVVLCKILKKPAKTAAKKQTPPDATVQPGDPPTRAQAGSILPEDDDIPF